MMNLACDVSALESQTYRKLCCLTPFHPNAVRLLGVSTESDSALQDFEKVFSSDPALSADLLTVANSAEFGSRARIASIRYALSFLGLNRVRSLAFTIAMSRYMRSVVDTQTLQAVWMHGVATAVIAERLGCCYDAPQPHLYTAGLVHDVGRLGFLLSNRDYALLLNQEFRDLKEADLAERSLFGVTHAEAGAFLAKSWNFPPLLCDCIRYHHDHTADARDELIRTTRRACLLASELGYTEVHCPLEDADRSSAADAQRRCGLSLDQIKELIEARAGMVCSV